MTCFSVEYASLDQYNMLKQWEPSERERYLYPPPITSQTRHFSRVVCLLKSYGAAIFLKGNFALLCQFIQCWDHKRNLFNVGGVQWFHCIEEDIYFIIGLYRRGEDLPQFLDVPVGFAVEKLSYS